MPLNLLKKAITGPNVSWFLRKCVTVERTVALEYPLNILSFTKRKPWASTEFFRILNCSFILRHFSLTNTFLVTKDFFKYLFKVAILICCLKSHLRTSYQCFMHSPVQYCHIFVHTRLPSDLHYFSISLKLILFTCQINNCKLLKQHFIF